MKGIIVVIISLIALTSLTCNKEQATQNHQYNIQAVQSDSNWVEITDTIDVSDEITCLAYSLIKWGTVFNTESDYKTLWEKSIKEDPYGIGMCNHTIFNPKGPKPNYYTPNIDFNNRSVFGFVLMTGPSKTKRQIFINDINKEYLFLLNIIKISLEERGDTYNKWISIPKIKSGYNVKFDTTFTINIIH